MVFKTLIKKEKKKIRFVIVNLTMKCWNEAYRDEISLIVVFSFDLSPASFLQHIIGKKFIIILNILI